MDNRLIIVQSESRKAFDMAFELLFESSPSGKASHYIDDPKKGLVFLWLEEKGCSKLPVALNAKQAAELAWTWLANKKDDEYHEYLDHDGSSHHGFKVYNEAWAKVGGYSYSILAVLPVWAWYGK